MTPVVADESRSVGDGDRLLGAVGDGGPSGGQLPGVELGDDHAAVAVVIGVEDRGGEAVAAPMAGAQA